MQDSENHNTLLTGYLPNLEKRENVSNEVCKGRPGRIGAAAEKRKGFVALSVAAFRPDEDTLGDGASEFEAESSRRAGVSEGETGKGPDGGVMRVEMNGRHGGGDEQGR
jgi:hypothetical protein